MKNNNEIWKDIPEFVGLYQVSNLGRVRSLGNGGTHKKPRILKSGHRPNGYLFYTLIKNGKPKYISAHRLVALLFIPNPTNLPQVNHKDENKENNCVENLEWCTDKYNKNYGTRNEKVSIKMTNNESVSKKVSQYTLGGNFIKTFPSAAEVFRQYGFDASSIRGCCIGKTKTSHGYKWKYE